MHPWGKWGRDFTEYGVAAARAALADAGVDRTEIGFLAGAGTIRNGYPGFIAGAAIARALGWAGERVTTSYAACAGGAHAIGAARAQILAGLCDVALVVGADSAPKGFFAPVGGERPGDPDWLRFRVLGATNPVYFALAARRRMAVHGSTPADFAAVKAKNSRHGAANPHARYRSEVTAEQVLTSPMVADPLHLLDICATSDGAAALVLTGRDRARRLGREGVGLAAVATVSPRFPEPDLAMPDFATDSRAAADPPEVPFRAAIAAAAYEEAGVAPADLDLAEVYDLSTAMELDWYEDIGLCPPGGAEALLHDGATAIGGRIPVNPSGGLASFGEAVPAQAIAQVCELARQIGGRAGPRQVEGARVGIAVNQGLFGHGSAVVVRG
ncbi:lipid-transfer protein [Nocardiopsis sediminis]|uniref:Lipid-transfer protein n=1 Tax=Nocardiopsis sediminis TaxID=1778267 RepID=A0ABV8FET0_9ACTN